MSICIPTFNRPSELARVVDEMLAQSYPSMEIVVIDDGDSSDTLRALGDRTSRIRYHANESRLGIYANWNRAVSLATGDLVAVYHDHDHYAPRIVSESVRLFETYRSAGLVHVATRVRMPDGRCQNLLHELPEFMSGLTYAKKQAWQWHSYVAHGSMMVKRELYARLGVFRPELGIAADMEMLTRFCLDTDIGYVRQPLYTCMGRQQGDALFGFKWSDLSEYAAVRRLNLGRLYSGRLESAAAYTRFQAQLDLAVIRELAAARVHGRSAILSSCGALVADLSPPARWLAYRLRDSSSVTDSVVAYLHRQYRRQSIDRGSFADQ